MLHKQLQKTLCGFSTMDLCNCSLLIHKCSHKLLDLNDQKNCPGGVDNPLLKLAFFNVMIEKWQVRFGKTTFDLNNPACAIVTLCNCMMNQETLTDALSNDCSDCGNQEWTSALLHCSLSCFCSQDHGKHCTHHCSFEGECSYPQPSPTGLLSEPNLHSISRSFPHHQDSAHHSLDNSCSHCHCNGFFMFNDSSIFPVTLLKPVHLMVFYNGIF